MRYDALIFDLDGTLADTLRTIAAAVNHGLAAVGLETLSLERVARIVGEGVATLCERALPPDRAALHQDLLREVRAYYALNPMQHCRLYPGIDSMLDRLAVLDARLAVLSNKPHELTVATLRGLGIEARFREVLGHREEFPRKPDPTSVRWLIERLGVERDRVLYVGDTPIDIGTARAAGLAVAAVTWGFRPEEELSPLQPDFIVRSPREILAICERNGDAP
jgi:phosphoglycolate phosphatase